MIMGVFLGINNVWAQGSANTGTTGRVNQGLPTDVKVNPTAERLTNPLKAGSVEEVIYLAVDLAVYFGVILAMLAIVFIGFKFVLAQGKPEEIKEAKMWFFYVIIGLAILISSKVIVEIIQNTFIQSGVVNKEVFKRN